MDKFCHYCWTYYFFTPHVLDNIDLLLGFFFFFWYFEKTKILLRESYLNLFKLGLKINLRSRCSNFY